MGFVGVFEAERGGAAEADWAAGAGEGGGTGEGVGWAGEGEGEGGGGAGVGRERTAEDWGGLFVGGEVAGGVGGTADFLAWNKC